MKEQPKYRLVPSEAYSNKRDQIKSRTRLRLLKWAEEEIADDPNHVFGRRPSGRGTIIDSYPNKVDLEIEFAPPIGDLVELRELIDFYAGERPFDSN